MYKLTDEFIVKSKYEPLQGSVQKFVLKLRKPVKF